VPARTDPTADGELSEAKTYYFPVFVRKCQMLGIFTALKTKEFTLVNDCFQCKNNEADGVF